MKRFLVILSCSVFLLTACTTTKVAKTTNPGKPQVVNMDTLKVTANPSVPDSFYPYHMPYRPSFNVINDLVNTKLSVKLNWQTQQLYGKATISFKPHFYPTDTLTLDAKRMFINRVALIDGKDTVALYYDYSDSLKLKIKLDRIYTRNDEYTLFIDYMSNPQLQPEQSGGIISSTKGLFFINPDGKNKDKPTELWTQGETEDNSVWFPTIDKPNVKSTEEIYLTVDTQYVTLSNGLQVSSKKNVDGTRTDYWKMDKPISPYLFMIVVGKFSVYHDKWRNIDVNYYTDPAFAPYAKEQFGRTPKMIEFFSTILGYDFPWPKYSQVVVHDFVTGAMENCSAVTMLEDVNMTHREMIDDNGEEYICHELFHHWFGDLVTCKSWSQIALNESFARYGETLWYTHAFGKDMGDYHFYDDLTTYLNLSPEADQPLIRYYYDDKEKLFDHISYEKGCCILNMLRNYIGDDAFFKSLNLYLKTNAYQNADVNDLRTAFEKTTGKDLNWFFNEWFLAGGHPELNMDYNYNSNTHIESVAVSQIQNTHTGTPLYRLPMAVDIYYNGKVERHNIDLKTVTDTFRFSVPVKPNLVNVDADKIICGEKSDNKSDSAFAFQYYHAPLYKDRAEAIEHFKDVQHKDMNSQLALFNALNDKFWALRVLAIKEIDLHDDFSITNAQPKLIHLAQTDSSSQVRAAALEQLGQSNNKSLMDLFISAINDSSYLVEYAALNDILGVDTDKAFAVAKTMSNDSETLLVGTISDLFAKRGMADDNGYFLTHLDHVNSYSKYQMLMNYGTFIGRMESPVLDNGINYLEDKAQHDDAWVKRLGAMNGLFRVFTNLGNRLTLLNNQLSGTKNTSPNYASIQQKAQAINDLMNQMRFKIRMIIDAEQDPNLKKMYHKAG